MARRTRNRELDIGTGIAQLVAFIALGAMFVPGLRQILTSIVWLLVAVTFLTAMIAAGVIIYRRMNRQTLSRVTMNCFVPKPQTPLVNEQELRAVLEKVRSGQRTGLQPAKTITTTPKPAWPANTADLIEQLRSIDWFQFEKLVGLVYRKLGYAVTRRGGANPDGGIDLVIEKDGQCSAVQCKQWKTWNVGVSAVREFKGALAHAGIQKGIFITLRGYTGQAKQLAQEDGIEILNETGLTKLLEQAGARFDSEVMDLLSDTRKFCPKCEREMVLKTAKRGSGAGKQFWACPGYPKYCNYTMPTRDDRALPVEPTV